MTWRLVFTEQYNRRAARFLRLHPDAVGQYAKTLKLPRPTAPLSLRLNALGGSSTAQRVDQSEPQHHRDADHRVRDRADQCRAMTKYTDPFARRALLKCRSAPSDRSSSLMSSFIAGHALSDFRKAVAGVPRFHYRQRSGNLANRHLSAMTCRWGCCSIADAGTAPRRTSHSITRRRSRTSGGI